MRMLLTGSNGFIGGRIAALAHAHGVEVTGLGRAPKPVHLVDRYLSHDLAEPIVTQEPVDVVVHCAALASPWAPPAAYESANVAGTRHVLDWCQAHGNPRLVQISSSSVLYRDADQLELTEESPVPPDSEQLNTYSRTKRASERLVEDYPGSWVILRPRAVFGPGDTVLLPRVVAAARRGRLPILERPGGSRLVTDLTYVDTVAHYVLVAAGAVPALRGAPDASSDTVLASGIYLVTNGEHVELYPFLTDVLEQLGCPRPRRRIPVGVAMAAAGVAETVSAAVLGYREPLITRFGVSVLAHSKTFNVSKCQRDLGLPLVSLAQGVQRLVAQSTQAEHG